MDTKCEPGARVTEMLRLLATPARRIRKDATMATATDRAAQERWEKENARAPLRPEPPTTVSGVPIDALYSPEQLGAFDPDADLGYPGQYPFVRGVHAS